MDHPPPAQPQQPQPQPLRYICGDCGIETSLLTNGVIQCSECYYRILYKKRTTCVFQYDAR